MRRTGLLLGGWALATVLALLLGLQSVSAISDSVTGRTRKTLSPSSVRAALDRSVSSDDSGSSDALESSESASSSPDGSRSSSSASSSSESNDPASDDDGGSSASSSSASSSSSGPGGGGGGDDDGSSSSQAFPPPQDQTFDSEGGTVTVRFENGQAHLLLRTSHDGFSCEDDSNSSSVDVRCKSLDGSHESRIRAFWNNGPQHTVEEKS